METEPKNAREREIWRAALIHAAKLAYAISQKHVEFWEYSKDAKATAIDMQNAVGPVLDELGMTWPEILSS